MEPGQAFGIIGEDVREDFEGHIPAELGISGAVHLAHAALADEGGDFVGAEERAWAEGHGKMARVYRSGPSDWLSKAHVRMLSDDPVDLRGHTEVGRLGKVLRAGGAVST